MSFEDFIRDWVAIDNQMKLHKDKINELRADRTELKNKILTTALDNDLDNATIRISDGRLKIQNVRSTAPLTLKFIHGCLSECFADEKKVEQLLEYIKSKREIRYSHDIKRYYTKTN
jgi:hypothetical protein